MRINLIIWDILLLIFTNLAQLLGQSVSKLNDSIEKKRNRVETWIWYQWIANLMRIIPTCLSYPPINCGCHRDRKSACHFGPAAAQFFPCQTTRTKSSTGGIFVVHPAFCASIERKFFLLTYIWISFAYLVDTRSERRFLWTVRISFSQAHYLALNPLMPGRKSAIDWNIMSFGIAWHAFWITLKGSPSLFCYLSWMR